MKKLFLSATLLLVAAGTWAFYPKAAEPGGYMMVIGRESHGYSIITISPSGETSIQPVTKTKQDAEFALRKAEILKVNDLKQNGWKVINTTTHSVPGYFEEVYLLEK
ncbi:hypothetical protein ACFQ48_17450 [Hymenobacter caeli]|uniref:DUF4907 domain-containing protein n=1 Tax=Hymenobacter caeli TaxID=2735894 RepID=A0ABX2FWF9_9BACT|nr:hypothetical protein [Hymenobacter caeli]NRT20720.1 hypothetical protein [Hymenobacter caeli]